MDAYTDLLEEWEIQVNLLDEDDNALKPPSGLELFRGWDMIDKDGNYYMGGVNNGKGLGECAHWHPGLIPVELNQNLLPFQIKT